TQWTTEPPAGPIGLGIDSQDNIYVALKRQHDHYLYKFDSSGHFLLAWGTTGGGDGQFAAAGNEGIQGIAVDKQGFLYASDPSNGRIQQFDLNGTFVASWSWGKLSFGPTYQVAVDPDGYVYIPFGSDGTLGKFDSKGNLLARWQSPQIENASLRTRV